jgi:hypothetical protein
VLSSYLAKPGQLQCVRQVTCVMRRCGRADMRDTLDIAVSAYRGRICSHTRVSPLELPRPCQASTGSQGLNLWRTITYADMSSVKKASRPPLYRFHLLVPAFSNKAACQNCRQQLLAGCTLPTFSKRATQVAACTVMSC